MRTPELVLAAPRLKAPAENTKSAVPVADADPENVATRVEAGLPVVVIPLMATAEAAVARPLPSNVTWQTWLESPQEPVLAFTVARVAASVPEVVMSPLRSPFVMAVAPENLVRLPLAGLPLVVTVPPPGHAWNVGSEPEPFDRIQSPSVPTAVAVIAPVPCPISKPFAVCVVKACGPARENTGLPAPVVFEIAIWLDVPVRVRAASVFGEPVAVIAMNPRELGCTGTSVFVA